MSAYRVLADTATFKAGAVVYAPKGWDYGLATDDTRATGIEHVSVSTVPSGDYPTQTIPTEYIEVITDAEAAAYEQQQVLIKRNLALIAALQGVIRVADRNTAEFNAARAALALTDPAAPAVDLESIPESRDSAEIVQKDASFITEIIGYLESGDVDAATGMLDDWRDELCKRGAQP